MGDKSPKSKNRAKSQKSAAKKADQKKADQKQERKAPTMPGGRPPK